MKNKYYLFDATANQARFVVDTNGNIGIGTTSPLQRMHVAGGFLRVDGLGNEQIYIGGDGFGNDVQVGSFNPGVTTVSLYNHGSSGFMKLVTSELEIKGGSDLAEPFEIRAEEAVRPGMVVAIDPEQPGGLRLATRAYDRTVVGIISGAGGINPGLVMRKTGSVADGKHSVALAGRVYTLVDASKGAVEPGDLLTTSDTPGHAMKVSDVRQAHGAVIGKAMTSLKEGRGLVLVLVTQQ